MTSHRLLTDDVVRDLDARRASLEEADDILEALDRAAWTPEEYHGKSRIPWGSIRPRPRRTIETTADPVLPGFHEVLPEDLRETKDKRITEAA